MEEGKPRNYAGAIWPGSLSVNALTLLAMRSTIFNIGPCTSQVAITARSPAGRSLRLKRWDTNYLLGDRG